MHGTHTEGVSQGKKNQQQAFLMVRGETHASTSGKMKYDPDWDKASMSYNFLQILALIEKTVLDQNEDKN